MKFFSLFLLLANSIYHADAFDPFYKSLILRQVKFDAIKNAQQRRTLPQGPRSWPEANTRPTTCQAELDQILNLQQEQKNLAENYEVLQHQIVDSQNKNVDLENLIEAYKVEIDQKDEKIAFCESSNSVVELGPVKGLGAKIWRI